MACELKCLGAQLVLKYFREKYTPLLITNDRHSSGSSEIANNSNTSPEQVSLRTGCIVVLSVEQPQSRLAWKLKSSHVFHLRDMTVMAFEYRAVRHHFSKTENIRRQCNSEEFSGITLGYLPPTRLIHSSIRISSRVFGHSSEANATKHSKEVGDSTRPTACGLGSVQSSSFSVTGKRSYTFLVRFVYSVYSVFRQCSRASNPWFCRRCLLPADIRRSDFTCSPSVPPPTKQNKREFPRPQGCQLHPRSTPSCLHFQSTRYCRSRVALSYTEERRAALLVRTSAFWWPLLATSSASHTLAPSIRLSAIPAASLTFPSRVFACRCWSPARASVQCSSSSCAGWPTIDHVYTTPYFGTFELNGSVVLLPSPGLALVASELSHALSSQVNGQSPISQHRLRNPRNTYATLAQNSLTAHHTKYNAGPPRVNIAPLYTPLPQRMTTSVPRQSSKRTRYHVVRVLWQHCTRNRTDDLALLAVLALEKAAGRMSLEVEYLKDGAKRQSPKHNSTSAYTRQKAKSKYRNRIRLERVSQKQSSETHKTPYDRVKRCRELSGGSLSLFLPTGCPGTGTRRGSRLVCLAGSAGHRRRAKHTSPTWMQTNKPRLAVSSCPASLPWPVPQPRPRFPSEGELITAWRLAVCPCHGGTNGPASLEDQSRRGGPSSAMKPPLQSLLPLSSW
ncbi:hypothetical protein PR048_006290 [Dryococelus australis]|uniref:Uncharacterized protein n=1 Tax=Dryococelus australis TaxID=614101 RepID=A0ABQ9IAJ7_9NEOP|nr:hypothetical protein PR048_006290 [Dryococelus australis]